jgi:hypothetical protein
MRIVSKRTRLFRPPEVFHACGGRFGYVRTAAAKKIPYYADVNFFVSILLPVVGRVAKI